MADFTIPQDLVAMARTRRLIPFVGAGFSAPLSLPSWEQLLAVIAQEAVEEKLTFDEIKKYCNDDLLQMAEYFFLKCDRSIGPLRHAVSKAFGDAPDSIQSGAHIELVNLGAQQIYTTNYDEGIEATYKALNEPVNVISLPKHVATVDGGRTQVVKYHGDLRHDQTLVLTESSYYARLDFESPMDLKFRSDILGRSVLFMGYSFRDINIRIIWFKLMRMMKDIHHTDRPTSYIVTLKPNPVLETLYDAVGIRTIVLDPNGEADTASKKIELFAEFLLELSFQASKDGMIPGQGKPRFFSQAMFIRLLRVYEEVGAVADSGGYFAWAYRDVRGAVGTRIPQPFFERIGDLLLRFGMLKSQMHSDLVQFAMSYAEQCPPHHGLTMIAARAMTRKRSRDALLEHNVPWEKIWGAKLPEKAADALLDVLKSEIENHVGGEHLDDDLAYAADVAVRIRDETIVEEGLATITERARSVLNRVAEIYSIEGVGELANPLESVRGLIAEIKFRKEGGKKGGHVDDDEIPF